MSDFRFANPDASIGLWVVLAIVVVLLWLQQRRHQVLSRFISPVMQSRLVSRPSSMRGWSAIIALGLSAACLVVALMRPQFGLTYVKSPRVGAQIMFCLDVSKSMLAEDTAPNRLGRAKADINDLLTFLDGDQVGLIGFAGRASVLCPLTPDYGFFKLILDGANPSSVGRGGTRLEEPIRKALDGFRSGSDVSRIVVLITDGEDHDSHPLDVAKEAVERGIKVVAIGMGDEAGSEIYLTDPRTGVQSQVRDSAGNPVITRLDGETLRELALATEGVYIPAGTGSLDLKSIYDAHIQPLVRGEMETEGRAIRQDAFQWAILAALLFLMAGVVLGSGRVADAAVGRDDSASSSLARAAIVFAVVSVAIPAGALADEDPKVSANKPAEATVVDVTSDPRDVYNRALKQLDNDFDEAEKLFTMARQEAATDGEVRFRATYNMGWVEVHRADALIEEQPQQAIEHLQLAAGWFRDAVRLRKDAHDARHNLEVVLLRILQLRDQLSNKEAGNLAAQLDAMISSQRNLVGKVRVLVEQLAASDDPNVADKFRAEFRRLAVDQRVALSDLQGLVENASSELQTLQSKPEAERKPEENIRIAQLAGLLSYVNQSNQRMGQSRSQLRRRQASRAFRRAAAGLNLLKRARDQLRGPLEILDGLLADARTTAQQTALMSLESQIVTSDTEAAITVPSWIDQEYLAGSQSDLTSRTEELTNRLASGLESPSPDAPDASQQVERTPDQQEFLARLQQAMPFLQRATDAMKLAGEKISLPEYGAASRQQFEAITALQEARERFADLRALIELAFATETKITDALGRMVDAEGPNDDAESEHAENQESIQRQIISFAAAAQNKNLERMKRLKAEVSKQLSDPQPTTDGPNDDSQESSPETQRLVLASEIVDRIIEQMNGVVSNLPNEFSADEDIDNPNDEPSEQRTDQSISDAKLQADAAVETLTELRRLFFSIVEHLQETAQRQATLNDDTEQLVGTQSESENDPAVTQQQTAPLASRQQAIAKTAEQIAGALQQQANQPTTPGGQDDSIDPEQQQMIAENADNAKKAAELVSAAHQQMTAATEFLDQEKPQAAEARPPQDTALEKLIEALQQLQPPQQDQSNQQQQSDENQQQQKPSGENEQEQQTSQNSQMDPSRVLQAVRDREAQRRRDRDQRQRASQVPVDKDW